jgi:hypothetical protein
MSAFSYVFVLVHICFNIMFICVSLLGTTGKANGAELQDNSHRSNNEQHINIIINWEGEFAHWHPKGNGGGFGSNSKKN